MYILDSKLDVNNYINFNVNSNCKNLKDKDINAPKKGQFIRKDILSIAFKSLAFLITFSLIVGGAYASPLGCERPLNSFKSNTCPSFDINHANSSAYRKAMEVLKMPETQQILTFEGNHCPYGSAGFNPVSQKAALTHLMNNKKLTEFIFNKKLKNEISDINKKLSFQPLKINRGDLIKAEMNDEIDLSLLMTDEDPIQIRLLKSYKGIRIAQPGDQNITLYISSDPIVDHNGVFHHWSFEYRLLDSLKIVSQKHPIHFIQVTNISDLIKLAIQTKNLIGNIKIMIIAGHGTENSITLGENFYHTFEGKFTHHHKFTRYITDLHSIDDYLPIDSDGTIILFSCAAGSGGLSNPNNLVNQIALSHLGVTVIGQKKAVGSILQVHDIAKRQFSFLYNREDGTYSAKAMRWDPYSNTILEEKNSTILVEDKGIKVVLKQV